MPVTGTELRALLEAVARGAVEPGEALARLSSGARELGFARPDLERELRQEAPEAVLGEGKSPGQVVAIVSAMAAGGAGSVLVTRADRATRAAVRAAHEDAREDERARAVWLARAVPEPLGLVVMVSAGTSDGPALHEARIRAELLGAEVVVHEDCGVAGLHRLGAVVPDLARADCVVVAAGMDGALASVVGGLVAAPVIGLPTSAGYGSARGGETALHAMLASCAAGVAVVGIDDGLGAGTIAARIARSAAAQPPSRPFSDADLSHPGVADRGGHSDEIPAPGGEVSARLPAPIVAPGSAHERHVRNEGVNEA